MADLNQSRGGNTWCAAISFETLPLTATEPAPKTVIVCARSLDFAQQVARQRMAAPVFRERTDGGYGQRAISGSPLVGSIQQEQGGGA